MVDTAGGVGADMRPAGRSGRAPLAMITLTVMLGCRQMIERRRWKRRRVSRKKAT